MNNKILGILPESIGGRLTISSIFDGFKANGYTIDIIDELDKNFLNKLNVLNSNEYKYIVGYDYSAVKIKKIYNIDIVSINYFSDLIESDLADKSWGDYYDELKKKDNFVFYWDRILTNEYKSSQLNIYYLPHCVNTDVYNDLNLSIEYDIMFAGRLTFEPRMEYLIYLLDNLPNMKFAIFSYRKYYEKILEKLQTRERNTFLNCYKGFIENEKEMSIAINKSKIVLNFHSQGLGALNYRVFQTLACRKLLLTDYRLELEELFSPSENVIYYKNKEDLLGIINDYNISPNTYNNIVEEGRKKIETSYSHKIITKKILDIVDKN